MASPPSKPGAELAYEVLSDQVIRQVSAVDGLDTKLGVAVAALIAVTGAIYAAAPPRIFAALVSSWVLVALVQAIRGFRYDKTFADGVNAKFLEERMHLQPAEIKRRSAETRNEQRLKRKGRLLTQVTVTLGLVAAVGLIGKMLGVS